MEERPEPQGPNATLPSPTESAKSVENASDLDKPSTENPDTILVEYTPNDPEDPRNWPPSRKWLILISLTFANFATP
jgi:hypothetical protein